MTTRRSRRVTRRSAAQALDGRGSSGAPEVDKALIAVKAAGTPFELNREADTVAMFRSTHRTAAVVRPTRVQVVRARLAATPALVAGATAVLLAGGGVALVASTGHLPDALGGDHRSPTGSTHSSQAPGKPTAAPTKKPGKGKPTASTSLTPSLAPSPTPSLNGLCRAYQAGAASNPGKAEDNPAFTALATAAGGKDKIATFCLDLIGTPSSQPTHPAGPTKPTQAAEPTKPAHPAHPAKPSKAPKPTKSPKATETASTSH